MITMKSSPKSLYVHIPFCEHICSYCNFIKIYYDEKVVDKYLDCLEKELQSFHIENLDTIYIGGGTPSSLKIEQLEKLLSILSKIPLNDNYEYTMEANPENLSKEKIMLLKKYGVNRISLGIQTFDEKISKLLNRKHNFKMVKEVVNNLNSIGINNYSFDFIYAVPFQTKEIINKDINLSLSLNPKHLSFYSLLIEENTLLYIQKYKEADDTIQREFYDFIYEKLKENGFNRYEISNFSKPNYESKHNLTYWLDEKYYAIGLSSSGYIEDKRYTNTKNMTEYLKENTKRDIIKISKNDEMFEYIMLNLRLDKGIDLSAFSQKFKIDLLKIKEKEIEELEKRKLIYIKENHLRTTYNGSLLLHLVIEKLT